MPSRRDLLASLGAAAAAGLAGCATGSSDSAQVASCVTEVVDRGDGDVLGAVVASSQDGAVTLAVPTTRGDVTDAGVDGLAVRDADGGLVTWIPVDPAHADRGDDTATPADDDRLRYEYDAGERPHHARYRVVAVDAAREAVDSLTVDVNCFADG